MFPRFAADESLVGFHDCSRLRTTTKFATRELALPQGRANPLQHEPCRLLRNAEIAGKFVRANTVLAIRQHPHCRHPLIKAERGIFHDRLDLHRELLLAGIAEPKPARLDERKLLRSTPRAVNLAVRPAKANRGFKSALRIGKVGNRFLEGFQNWRLGKHEEILYEMHMCVKDILTA